MQIVIVLRKRLSDPTDFDKLIEDTHAAIDKLGFDSVHSQLAYDPDSRLDGDISFTSKGT